MRENAAEHNFKNTKTLYVIRKCSANRNES